MEKMEESGADEESQEKPQPQMQVEETEEESEDPERGGPSTPKWWRPPIPPETYKWEEMRRQRQKGGYPWTHLDKEEEIDADDYLDENLYEPVNPPPLYGNESYLSKDLQQVPQIPDEPMIEIPPELEIITSEGLDGLDKPDPHDHGFDGDREWQNIPSEDEGAGAEAAAQSKSALIGKPREARPTTPKSVGFSPETITHEVPEDDPGDQEVPEHEHDADEVESTTSGTAGHSSHGRKKTPFDILKSKVEGAADQVKQRIKSAIPVRPKWQGKRSKKRKKAHQEQEEDAEQEGEEGEEGEKMEVCECPEEEQVGQSDKPEEATPEGEKNEEVAEKVEASDESEKLTKEQQEEEKKRKKEEEKLQQQKEKEEKERKKAEEKLAKQKAAEEAKKAKEEEKAREAEEKRKAKEEEEKRKQAEKEEAARIAAEKKKEEEARKAAEKAKKEEEARKAAEAKKEEEARKAAEKAKKEEEARLAAEAKKAEEEAKKAAEKAKKEEEEAKKAAEKAKKEEEAKLAAEAKKAEEEARKAAEQVKKDTETDEEVKMEDDPGPEVAEPAAVEEQGTAGENEDNAEGANEEGQEEEAMDVPPQTPTGTTKRKYIRHRRQLPQIPNPITTLRNQVEDFKNKLKRSRTPPRRQVQRKHRRSRSADASRSPPREPEDEPEKNAEEDEGEPEKQEEKEDEKPEAAQESTSESKSSAPVKVETAPAVSTEVVTESMQTAVPERDVTPARSEEPSEPASSGTGTQKRSRKQPAAKEALDKIGQQLKGIGVKSIQASKEVGQKMKVVGKDLQKLGSKAMGEIKAKQDAAKNRKASQVSDAVEVGDDISLPEAAEAETVAPPQRTFRFKRRGESQDEADEDMEREEQGHFYENEPGPVEPDRTLVENRLLGSGAKDWESPSDRAQSRDVSEEPCSGNASARDSPPGSSLASSTFAQVRRTGVLEEIDSDEFFLRERGISEGEDEEEINKFLVEELRQAFRPTMASNALKGFDMEPVEGPPRPDRAPRKPPRKDKEEPSPSMYQTFPPERPKRKQPQGYVSKFMKEHEDEYDDMGSNEEVRGSSDEMREDIETEEGFQMLKAKLSKIESEEEETQIEMAQSQPENLNEYEDDGKYEPISEVPIKPTRTKRKQPQLPPTPPSFYYNTIAANEWLRELENTEVVPGPAVPVRTRRGSGRSSSLPRSEGSTGIAPQSAPEFLNELEQQIIPVSAETEQAAEERIEQEPVMAPIGGAGIEDSEDYIDEAGYAIVQKDREVPTTIPRKKKKRGQMAQGAAEPIIDPSRAFFSMPRPSHQVNDNVPPERPNRTYSTLHPRRPPRSKSGSRTNLDKSSPAPSRRDGATGESRPSNIINLMQGRPLPPPPRPQRSPASVNDLDQNSIEMSVGLRHYANFDDIEPVPVEEAFVTGSLTLTPRVTEVDMACQTDPVPEDEFIVGMLTTESLIEDGSRVITASSRLERMETRPEGQTQSRTPATAGDDVSTSSFQTPPPRPPHTQSSHTAQSTTETFPQTQSPPPPFVFPSRLHLEQLEVDFLKVNDLCAQRIKVEHLQASQLQANSMSATGPISASQIQTQSLQSDEVSCSKLTSDAVNLPSIPPLSFYQLSSSDQAKPGSEQELCLKTEEKGEKENESACPLEFHDSMQNLMGNVDSTNDMKSSHVAEKILDKQLNVAQSSPASEQSKVTRKDASVGTPSALPRNVPVQMNDLNQPSPPTVQSETSQQSRAPLEQESANVQVEPEDSTDPPVEEAVVVGSYTLPYSYMSSQPTPPARTGSVKKIQKPEPKPAPRKPSTPREEAHVAFGHTSVAQGDVLSVKLSIPVDRAALEQTAPGAAPSSPKSQRTVSSTTPPVSSSPTADSARRESAPKPTESGRKSSSTAEPSTSAAATPTSPRQTPPSTSTAEDDSSESGEGLLTTSAKLGRAVLRFSMRSLQAMADYIDTAASEDPNKVEQQRANMQVLLCLLLVLVVGLILATTRSGPYSTPRWEFLFPPPDL